MKTKSETVNLITKFFKMVETQFRKKIKLFRTDNGGEFLCKTLTEFLKLVGCIHQKSCPYTPQQNGVVERKHRHLLDVARALMIQSHLPKLFRGDSILAATHIINRLPTSVLRNKCPWGMLFGSVAPIDHLKVFGCLSFVSTLSHQRDKLDPRAMTGVFLGYPSGQKGFQIYILETKDIVVSRNVVFKEHIFPFAQSTQCEKQDHIDFLTPTTVSDNFFSNLQNHILHHDH